MNDQPPPHPAELSLQRALGHAEDFVRREPTKAVAIALGAAVLLKTLPTRFIASPFAMLSSAVLPTALLGLGLIKAFELCVDPPPAPQVSPSRPPQGL